MELQLLGILISGLLIALLLITPRSAMPMYAMVEEPSRGSFPAVIGVIALILLVAAFLVAT
jgi:hypothetical protein